MPKDWNRPFAETAAPTMRRHGAAQIRAWLAGLVLCIVLVGVSIAFVDRPLALWVHQFHGVERLAGFSYLPPWAVPAAILSFAALALGAVMGFRSGLTDFMLSCGIALIVSAVIKDQLKFLFGRTWPESWLNGNRSFVANGVYGFWPLHGGEAYASFPSGHTTVAFAVLTLFWIRWPRLRFFCVLAGAAAVIALVGGGFHWLSDSIAGAFLGAAVGYIVSVLSGTNRGVPAH
ncbi:MAG TPA: phosphatase PAP2 family protein [Stellaceae bacterium]|nr:phosphatase PAP2 family protein [Stellaceae bacterium]